MMLYLIVFLGAGIGGALRHGVNGLALRLTGPNFPTGTMAVNIVGSLLMGLIVGYFAFRGGTTGAGQMGQQWRLFLTTGVLGGFTTFSAFSLDALDLIERGRNLAAAAYIGGSVGLSILGLWAGLMLARGVWGP
jgi:CrcB protein